MDRPIAPPASVDESDVARFSALAGKWWDPKGPFAPLHRLNPARLGFIRDQSLSRFSRDGGSRRPFSGLSLIDVGCGGGLLCEPMARLGFGVTGLDASAEVIDVARAHAEASGLSIDYRAATVEDLAASHRSAFDLVLALEVIEHVIDPAAFLRQCAALLAPSGMMIVATLNRTVRSLLLAKIGAEYLLRWVPVGTHDWRKFPTPAEVCGYLEAAGLQAEGPFGLALDPLAGEWRLSTDARVNFMMTAVPAQGPPLS